MTEPGSASRKPGSSARQASGKRPNNPPITLGTPIQNPPHSGSVPFAHPAEVDFARLLDFYRIPWHYEPTTFPLQLDKGRVLQMFTPDFYLPEHDLYVELTTMKQSLITKKRRKLRLLQELHPEIKIVLLTRRDYYELLSQFGYGAVEIDSLPPEDIERILYSQAEIEARVAELGAEISADYTGRSLVLIGLLKGVTFFMADLARAITRPLAVDYLAVATPHPGHAAGVQFAKDLDLDITGRHVLLIEDIITTGLSVDFVIRRLRERTPASLEVCALFDKKERHLIDVRARYVGFDIPNAFVVGYGLDYRELYRNLPFVCVLRPEVYARDHESQLLEINAPSTPAAH